LKFCFDSEQRRSRISYLIENNHLSAADIINFDGIGIQAITGESGWTDTSQQPPNSYLNYDNTFLKVLLNDSGFTGGELSQIPGKNIEHLLKYYGKRFIGRSSKGQSSVIFEKKFKL
ncbi:MAG: hypothetical protein AAF153_00725, partial [Pseudomonadota bacterium]